MLKSLSFGSELIFVPDAPGPDPGMTCARAGAAVGVSPRSSKRSACYSSSCRIGPLGAFRHLAHLYVKL